MRKLLMPVMAAVGMFAGLIPALADSSADRILGIWHTTDDKSQVQILKENNQYFGKVLSLKEPDWPAGSKLGKPGAPKNDRNNPDSSLRSHPIIGVRIVSNFVYDGKDVWAKGKVYDPENGKTYHGKITMVGTNRLELRGYIGISLLGRTVVWTR
jgi:uncharacterized protein (DUF2147 family)